MSDSNKLALVVSLVAELFGKPIVLPSKFPLTVFTFLVAGPEGFFMVVSTALTACFGRIYFFIKISY